MSLTVQFATAAAFFARAAAANSSACPGFEPVADLDLARYAGKWFEITRDKENRYQHLQSCNHVDYSHETGEREELGLTTHNYMFNSGWSTSTGVAYPSENGLKLEIDQIPDIAQRGPKPNYFIMATDYDSYSLSFSCPRFRMFTKDFLWVYSRDRTLSKEKMDEVRHIIAKALPGYDFDNVVHYTYQGKDCKYHEKYPELYQTQPRALPDASDELSYEWSSSLAQGSSTISTAAAFMFSYLVFFS